MKTPLAYATPHPAARPTLLDGMYAKLDSSTPQAWKCLRCADYRPAGGIWRLQFDQGVMRVLYEVTGWGSLASYSVSGDRIFIFNDPTCPLEIGEYTWALQDGALFLEAIQDSCSIDLRGLNFSKQPWDECSSELVQEGAVPTSCRTAPLEPPTAIADPTDVRVTVHPGDSRFYERPPDVIVFANSEGSDLHDGIEVSFSDKSISYGLNRILWWDGEWIQAKTTEPFSSMGVQFLGDPQIGWARVMFDGIVVWRGDTSEIWNQNARHGGYVEITSIGPGDHTLRVESLEFDFSVVTVASFGFSYEGGVTVGKP